MNIWVHEDGTECETGLVTCEKGQLHHTAPQPAKPWVETRDTATKGKEVSQWADAAMYRSEPVPAENRADGGGTRPSVRLLNATPDPLGTLAAFSGIYEGRVTRSLADVTDDQREAALKAFQSTVLNGPLEAVTFTFLVEGVTRAFTHQAVRSRFSFFAQESLRFAVVDGENWVDRSAYPPSLAAEPVQSHTLVGHRYRENPDYGPEERDYALKRDAWDDAIITAQQSYQQLIDAGVPAEDARGLMPHAMTTRYMWSVSLRTLLAEAGKRLCTQAQFEWRTVMAEVARSIRGYGVGNTRGAYRRPDRIDGTVRPSHDAWQFELIAGLLQPVCYQEGKCGFMAKFDRGCKIRDRVNANAQIARPSSEWGTEMWVGDPDVVTDDGPPFLIRAIHPEEWLTDPGAAR